MKNKSISTVAPLFLVLCLDGMGLGLLFPILNSIIVNPHTSFLGGHISTQARDFYYGLVVGIFMICWFFGATFLGDLSDTIGRKKALLICLTGAFFGYVISALAISWHSYWFLIFGRVIAGFTSGSQPIAQAAIIDVSTEEHKARNIGFILFAISFGFVLGPIIGGVLSDHHLVSWFQFSTPMYFIAVVSLLNAALLWFTFNETFTKVGTLHLKLHRAVVIFISAFKHQKIRYLSLVLLVMIYGWSNYFSFVSMYLLQRFHFDTINTSLFLSLLALGFGVACIWLVDLCNRLFSSKWTVVIGLVISSAMSLLTLLIHNSALVWIWGFVIGAGIALAYSTLLAMFSNQVSDDEQGWVMGVTGSIMALCFGLSAFLTGYLANLGVGIPIVLSTVGIGASAILMAFSSV